MFAHGRELVEIIHRIHRNGKFAPGGYPKLDIQGVLVYNEWAFETMHDSPFVRFAKE